MSLIFVHLRWDDVSAAQFDQVCRALPPGSPLPKGCRSHQLRHVGRTLLGTGAWSDDEEAERFVLGLPDLARAAGLAAPHVAAFSVPTPYGVGYTGPRVHQAGRQSSATAPLVPVTAPTDVPVPTEVPVLTVVPDLGDVPVPREARTPAGVPTSG